MVAPLADWLERPSPRTPWPAAPIPIALVITDLDPGGAEKALVALALGLNRSVWAPSVVCLAGEGVLAERLRTAGIPVQFLNVRRSNPVQAVGRLASAFAMNPPRLIQSFLFHANVASRLAAAKLAQRPPVLGGIRVAERQRKWHLTLERLTQGLGLGWVCVSNAVRDFSIQTARLDERRLTVIPNGIDAAEYDAVGPVPRSGLADDPNNLIALFAGRLDVQKGVDLLLDAFASAQHLPLSLAIAGDGPLREEVVTRLREDARLAGRARWLGRRDDVPALLKAADMLVLPSRWEGMPNVVLEAMAAGRPIIATDVDGTREIGFEGWRLPGEDPRALASALFDACSDRTRLSAWGLRNRLLVAKHHSQTNTVNLYDALWWRVLGFPVNPP